MHNSTIPHRTYGIVSAQYAPHIGGVERYTENLAQCLAKNNNRVIIITSSQVGESSYTKKDGIDIYRIPCISLLCGRYPVLNPLSRCFWQLLGNLCNINFDCFIINTRFYTHSAFFSRWARKRTIKSIIIEHGTNHLTVNNKIFDYFIAKIEHLLAKYVYNQCQNFYGVSTASCEWLKHFSIHAKGVLYNAVNIDDINQIIKNHKNNIPINFNDDFLIVSFIGRVIKEKGVLQLVKAFQRFAQENRKIALVLGGEGPELSAIKSLNLKNVQCLGKLSFEEVISVLCVCDIFCLPSDSEGFPTALLEACACHCFAIATNRGGIKEIIQDESYGYLLEDNSAESLYNAIDHIDKNRDLIEPACRKSYAYLCDNFTWEITAKKIENLV